MKKKSILIAVILIVLTGAFFIVRNDQHVLALQANQKIEAGMIKLMMTETEVKELLGEPEFFLQGFGGYMLEYPGKGITLTFLDDMDTDFYHKVDQIEVTDPSYSIYGISAGDDYQNSLDRIFKQGFSPKEGYPNYWKANLFITIEQSNNKVQKVTIGMLDRVASTRIY